MPQVMKPPVRSRSWLPFLMVLLATTALLGCTTTPPSHVDWPGGEAAVAPPPPSGSIRVSEPASGVVGPVQRPLAGFLLVESPYETVVDNDDFLELPRQAFRLYDHQLRTMRQIPNDKPAFILLAPGRYTVLCRFGARWRGVPGIIEDGRTTVVHLQQLEQAPVVR